MSESCGSNDFSHADGEVSSTKRTHKELYAYGEVSSTKRAHKELYLEEAESTEKMTSTAEQQSRSKTRRVIRNDNTEIILQTAPEFSKTYKRMAMTQVINEYESMTIAKEIERKHLITIPHKENFLSKLILTNYSIMFCMLKAFVENSIENLSVDPSNASVSPAIHIARALGVLSIEASLATSLACSLRWSTSCLTSAEELAGSPICVASASCCNSGMLGGLCARQSHHIAHPRYSAGKIKLRTSVTCCPCPDPACECSVAPGVPVALWS
ncbi:unnamed protein product [Vicia faba]|uniref:Uncharacterized protein n=1 Tax=Vicia faba TaxID=3906 RepID=A0AAV1B428_VICFA|nr:unnamed protein product [Vicia faba]